MTTQTDVLHAAAAGKQAFLDGLPVTACPYDPDEAPFLARGWVRGYGLAREAAGIPNVLEASLAGELLATADPTAG